MRELANHSKTGESASVKNNVWNARSVGSAGKNVGGTERDSSTDLKAVSSM